MARIKELSHQEKLFIEEYLKTGDHVGAYGIAYPNNKAPTKIAVNKLKDPRIQKAMESRRKELDAKRDEETSWTRGESIRLLKTLLSDSYAEIESKKEMKQELIIFIKSEIEANPEKLQLQEKLIKVKGMDILKRSIIEAITKAAEILNKMSGFNEETINNTNMPVVIFRGREDLLD